MKDATLEAWYQLHKTKDAKYFFALMESINPQNQDTQGVNAE